MRNGERRIAAAVLMSAMSALAGAQVRHAQQVAPRNALGITVFGVEQSGSLAGQVEAPQLRRLEGSLRDLLAPGYLRSLNPAVHLRVAPPALSPEVLVDVVAASDPESLQRALENLGLREASRASNLIGGWLPVSALTQGAQLPGVTQIRASMPRTRATGPVALQGDFVQGSSAVRTQYPSLIGTGLTVGLLSDSFNCYSDYAANGPSATGNGYNGYAPNGFTATQATDVSSGALPSGVDVLEDANCADYGPPQQLPFGDEGRAMAQIVHAVAPGAQLAFHTAVNSEADFAAGITSWRSWARKSLSMMWVIRMSPFSRTASSRRPSMRPRHRGLPIFHRPAMTSAIHTRPRHRRLSPRRAGLC